MATPEIKAKQVNTTDLSKLKNTTTSMPKTDSANSDKLASTLSGTNATSFGNLSKAKGSLASSLSTKTSSSSSNKSSVFGSTIEKSGSTSVFGDTSSSTSTETTTQETTAQASSDVSIYAQSTLKSNVNTIQNDIISAQNSSIFSKAGATSTTTTSSIDSASTSSTDFSSVATAKTYIAAAKDYASKAETAAQSGNWSAVQQYYISAQKELEKASAEIQKAQKNGENVGDLSTQISTLGNSYQQRINSAGKFLTVNSLREGVGGTVNVSNPSFASRLGTQMGQALAQGGGSALANKTTQSLFGGGQPSGGTQGAGGSGSAGGVVQGTKNTGNSQELDTRGVENNAEVKKAAADFKASQSRDNAISSQLSSEKASLSSINGKIESLKAKISGESDETIRSLVGKYREAKERAETNKQTVSAKQAEVNEYNAIVKSLTPQSEKLSSQYTSEQKAAATAQGKYESFAGKDGNGSDASTPLGKAIKAEADAKKAFADAPANSPEKEKARALWAKAQGELIKAKAEASRLKTESESKKQKAEATKKELEAVRTKLFGNKDAKSADEATADSPIKKLSQAKQELKEAQDAQKGLDETVKAEEAGMKKAEKQTEAYKKEIDTLYSQQTETTAKISDLESQSHIEDMTQTMSRETVDKVKKQYAQEKRSWYNPAFLYHAIAD